VGCNVALIQSGQTPLAASHAFCFSRLWWRLTVLRDLENNFPKTRYVDTGAAGGGEGDNIGDDVNEPTGRGMSGHVVSKLIHATDHALTSRTSLAASITSAVHIESRHASATTSCRVYSCSHAIASPTDEIVSQSSAVVCGSAMLIFIAISNNVNQLHSVYRHNIWYRGQSITPLCWCTECQRRLWRPVLHLPDT